MKLHKIALYGCLLVTSSLLMASCASNQQSSTKQSDVVDTNNDGWITDKDTRNEKAADFTILDANGNKVSLSDFKGKKVYINFWSSTCDMCYDESKDLETFYHKHKNDKDIVFLSVGSLKDKRFNNQYSIDKINYEEANSVLDDWGMTLPRYWDQNDSILKAYEIRSMPTHVFINSDGTLWFKFIGRMNIDALEDQYSQLT